MIKKNLSPPITTPHSLIIQETSFEPGTSGVVRLSAGKIPSGSKLDILAHVFRSTEPGPVLLLIGGIHGDEINGIEIITTLLEEKVINSIRCGTVIAIPLTNVLDSTIYPEICPMVKM